MRITSQEEVIQANDLNAFTVITFADLKKYKYYYWFAFPSFVVNPTWQMSDSGVQDVSIVYDTDQVWLF